MLIRMTMIDGSSNARRVLAVAVGAVLVVGCSSSADDNTTDTGPDTTGVSTRGEPDGPLVSTSEPAVTGGDTGRSPGEVTLIDAGREPRVALQITADARSRIAVDASEALDTTINDVTTSEAGEATYQLDLDIQVGADGVELLVAPTIVSIDGPTPAPDELGTWLWSLDAHGVVQRVVPVGRGHGHRLTAEFLNL